MPVAHPADDGASAVRSVAPADGGIVVFAVVEPFGRDVALRVGVGRKSLAVEIADEVLCAAAAERPSGVQIAKQHPLGVTCAIDF